jgi:prophage DNA circulation protein
VSVRDRTLAVVDQESDAAGETDDVEAYRALRALGLAVVRDFRARGATLSRISVVTPTATMPVLVLAYRYHGDLNQVDAIVARNGIRHPGFVPGGQPLELLGVG